MLKIDTERIKKMTNEKISYDLWKEEENFKMKKMKKSVMAIGIFVFCFMGIITANAATDGKIVQEIQKNINNVIKVQVNGKEKNANCIKNEDGTLNCIIDKSVLGVDDDIETSFTIDGNIDTGGIEIKIKNDQ